MEKRGYLQGVCSDGTKLYFGHPYWTLVAPNDEEKSFDCDVWDKNGKKIQPVSKTTLTTITSLSNEQNGWLVANFDHKAYAYINLQDGKAFIFKGAWHIKDIEHGMGAVSFNGLYHFFDTEKEQLAEKGHEYVGVVNRNMRIVGDKDSWKVLFNGVSANQELLEVKNSTYPNYAQAYDAGLDALSVSNANVAVGKGKIIDVPAGTFGKK